MTRASVQRLRGPSGGGLLCPKDLALDRADVESRSRGEGERENLAGAAGKRESRRGRPCGAKIVGDPHLVADAGGHTVCIRGLRGVSAEG